MKKSICFLLLLTLFACDKTKNEKLVVDRPTTRFFHSYVTCYCKGEAYEASYGDKWLSIQLADRNQSWIHSPDLSNQADGAEAAEFRRLSEQNGDTSYNREVTYLVDPGRNCLADPITKIEVICTSGDVDADHPAGSSINDLLRIDYASYAPYIRNNYTGEERTDVNKLLSELKEDDLTLVAPGFELCFDQPVETTLPLQLEITLTTSDGKTHVVNASFRPLQD